MTDEAIATVAPLRRGSRAERMRMPLARDVVEAVAVEYGVCVRPVAVRRTDMNTGETVVVDVPCGSTMASACRPCATRKKRLRMAQCREGWHLETEPVFAPDEPNREQRQLAALRADLTAGRDGAVSAGEDSAEWDEAIGEVDSALAKAGVRGSVDPAARARRVRSTRRRQDAPDLPKRRIEKTTLGRIYPAPGGKVFRPSVFLTLTCDSYGRVRPDGTPVDPDTYDYRRAARDAIHFGKVVDRFIQNLRRVAGYDVQYFATVEPQRRLAPHLHLAMRGTISRAELRMIAAATYHQVWWPSSDGVRYAGERLPVWDVEGAATSIRRQEKSCRPGIRRSMRSGRTTSLRMWSASDPSSTRKVSSRGRRTRSGASATSPST